MNLLVDGRGKGGRKLELMRALEGSDREVRVVQKVWKVVMKRFPELAKYYEDSL
jgi:hypothetical protein